jgi:hypothetical protein
VAPQVRAVNQLIEVKEGQPAKLECEVVAGSPPIHIFWAKQVRAYPYFFGPHPANQLLAVITQQKLECDAFGIKVFCYKYNNFYSHLSTYGFDWIWLKVK